MHYAYVMYNIYVVFPPPKSQLFLADTACAAEDYFQRPQMNEIFARKTDELRRQSVPEAVQGVNSERLGLDKDTEKIKEDLGKLCKTDVLGCSQVL